MSKLFLLETTGIPYPDMSLIKHLDAHLSGNYRFPVIFYGGWLRDLVLLGHTEGTGDIDTAMTIKDFLALKPTQPDVPDLRRHFVLHEPHLLFMLHQTEDDVIKDNPKPYVLALRPEHQADWNLDRTLGITLTRKQLTPADFAADVDLGFSGIASDGQQIWVTEAFVNDYRNKTITIQRCRDAMDFERTSRRLQKFLQGRYNGWSVIVPEEFRLFT